MRRPGTRGRRERAQAKRDRFAAQRAGAAGGARSGPSWEDAAADAEARAARARKRGEAKVTLFGRAAGGKAPKKHSKKGSRHVTG